MTDAIEVVIPVRNMADHLQACLASLTPQLRADDVITVVDDGSTDGSAFVAEQAGVRVVALEQGAGPYVARHTAAAASRRPFLLFIDSRSRALPGLIEAHRRLLSQNGVVLSCTNVDVPTGRTMPGKILASSKIFDISNRIGIPGRLDFYPTANLGVSKSAYDSVGGFRKLQSGGDVDLCWRIQLAGLGRLDAEPATLMHWIPRASYPELVRQWQKYGRSAALLDALYPQSSIRVVDGRTGSRYFTYLIRRAVTRPRELPMQIAVKLLDIPRLWSYRSARRAGFDFNDCLPLAGPPEAPAIAG